MIGMGAILVVGVIQKTGTQANEDSAAMSLSVVAMSFVVVGFMLFGQLGSLLHTPRREERWMFSIRRRLLKVPTWAFPLIACGLGIVASTIAGKQIPTSTTTATIGKTNFVLTCDNFKYGTPKYDVTVDFTSVPWSFLGIVAPYDQVDVVAKEWTADSLLPDGAIVPWNQLMVIRAGSLPARRDHFIAGRSRSLNKQATRWDTGVLTALFAAMLLFVCMWRMFHTTPVERRTLRIAAGLCPKCRYVGGHIGKCPECGNVAS